MNIQYQRIIKQQESEIAAKELDLERRLAKLEEDMEECFQMLQLIQSASSEESK